MLEDDFNQDAIEYPIDGILDLHHFRPSEVGQLIPDYLEECLLKGLTSAKIIHGKGSGQLREKVHAILRKLEIVEDFHLSSQDASSWGATVVILKKMVDTH